MDKKCLICGSIIGKNKKFCSHTCKKKYHYNKNLIKKKCKICGKDFLGKKSESCCSKKCFIESHKTETKKCLICKSEFTGSSVTRYCSKECYKVANSKKTKIETRTCIVCNKSFFTFKSKEQLVCSDICEANLFSVLVERIYNQVQNELKT